MAPLVIEGETLGKKHQHYNELVRKALAEQQQPEPFNAEDADLDNLFKIDLACKNRDLEYVLQVLKSQDLLYVSRAIKQSKWLVTDRQYSHIINPEYLHTTLFPQMTAKAVHKLLLHIRLNLKDEDRVDQFFLYYKETDYKTALKWLQHSSVSLIETVIEKHDDNRNADIPITLIKRLCEKSITILEKFLKKRSYIRRQALNVTKFLLYSDTEKYLDLAEKVNRYEFPSFSPKATEFLMIKCKQRILDNFEKYAKEIDMDTFAKHMKKEDIKDFLLKQAENKKLKSWFCYENIKSFVRYMPKEGRFEFLKQVLMEKTSNKEPTDHFRAAKLSRCYMMACEASSAPSTSANVYRWYRFAPFEVAFPDLIKLIRSESNPSERNAMLTILLTCANRNPQNVKTLLQYCHDKHINEPFKFKIQFVNMVLSKTNYHTFDEATWNILNNIFYSMEVFMESDNNVQSCVQAIILYKVLHNEKIPEIIEKKYNFNSMKSQKNKLNDQEKEKIFKYLYDTQVQKFENIDISNETAFSEAVTTLEEVLTLISDWDRNISNYPWVLNKIKNLIKIKKEYSWKKSLDTLYNKKKSWRKAMFEESLSLAPSENVCINSLKHDPELMSRHSSEVEVLRGDDNVSLQRLLNKLRVYWPQTLAANWIAAYTEGLQKLGGQKAVIRGLCTLLSQQELIELGKKYAPTETKINWSEDEELLINIRKNIAKSLHFARPSPSPDVVLLYAHGDYLQYALASLNAVLYNMSSTQSREHISKFLNAPVSLQKHGIRLAFTKLESDELKKIFSGIWKATKNSTIRAVLFKQTYKLLCKEKKQSMIEEIWSLLDIFIDNLSSDENKTIQDTMSGVHKVPQAVRGKFIMKCYKYLKGLPPKANCENILHRIRGSFRENMETLDPDFVAEELLDSLDKEFTTQRYHKCRIMSAYLLCVKDESTQMKRYEKVLLPILERSFALWKVKMEGDFFVRHNFYEILNTFCKDFNTYVLGKNMVFPSKIFTEIQNQMEKRLSPSDEYIILRFWKSAVTYMTILNKHKSALSSIKEAAPAPSPMEEDRCSQKSYESDDSVDPRKGKWAEVYTKAAPEFAESCVHQLKMDIAEFFPSIYLLYSESLSSLCQSFNLNFPSEFEIYNPMLKHKDFTEIYLLVLENIQTYADDDEKQKWKEIKTNIFTHESLEVRMHYERKFRFHWDTEEETS